MDANTDFVKFEQKKKEHATKKRRGPVRHVTVKPVAGGFISESEHEDMNDGSEPMYLGNLRSKKHHKTAEDLASHISEQFGGRQMVAVSPEADKESESAGAGDPNKE